MTTFANAMNAQANFGTTENGGLKLKSSTDALVDFYATVGAMRPKTVEEKRQIFEAAYKEDPLTATRILWYGRDAREGLGERQTFRDILPYAAKKHPESVMPNIRWIGEFGRWDDIYCLVGTPMEDLMWATVQNQLRHDLESLKVGNLKNISLLAKWLKTPDASSEKTKKLGIYTAKKLHSDVYHYKRMLRSLRKALRVVERDMSANRWGDINYSAVPSKAMTNYRKAFYRHDEERFSEFVNQAVEGKVKINSSVLYPYDIIGKMLDCGWNYDIMAMDDASEKTLEAQWRQLPNYVEPGSNVLVMADTSGSMAGRPIYTAVGLAIYFAQRNTGAYHGLWMNFSSEPTFQKIKGDSLCDILSNIDYENWGDSTSCAGAFRQILSTAIRFNVPASEMPKALVIISDMEFDDEYCNGNEDWTFYDSMKKEFEDAGYQIPNIIFWNVESRQDTFHADSRKKGVQLVSGQSASTFKQIMECMDLTPYQAMMKVIGSERYAGITVMDRR